MWVGPAQGTAHTGEYPMVSWLLPCTRWSLVETTSFLFLLSSAPHCTREAGLLSPVYPPLPPHGSQRELTNERAGLDLKDPGEEGPFALEAVAARPERFTAASQRVPENHRFPAIIWGLGWELPRHSCTAEFMRTRLDASGWDWPWWCPLMSSPPAIPIILYAPSCLSGESYPWKLQSLRPTNQTPTSTHLFTSFPWEKKKQKTCISLLTSRISLPSELEGSPDYLGTQPICAAPHAWTFFEEPSMFTVTRHSYSWPLFGILK